MGGLWGELVRFVFAVAALAAGGTAIAQSILTAVPGVFGETLAVNPVTNRIYVADESRHRVSVVDGVTHATTHIEVGRFPRFVTVNRTTNRIFVSNTSDATLTMIDGATHAATTFPINGAGPIVINEATNKVYVMRQGNNGEVTVFDANALTWYAMDTGSHTPAGIALLPALNRLYVSHNLSGDVRAIDTTSTSDHPPNVSIPIAGHPTAIAANPSTNRVYVLSDDERGPIVAIDGATNAATRITAPGHAIGPRAVAVNTTSNKVYAGYTREVVIVDGATHALTFVQTGTVQSIAVDATSNKAYVLDLAYNLTVIDGTTNATVTLPLGRASYGVAVNPNTNRAYTAGDGLTVIEGAGTAPPPPPSFGINAQALWWQHTESGWGINVTHQGNTLFATLFTYDASGRDMWLVMSTGVRTQSNTYEGELYRTTGPAFSSSPFDGSKVVRTQVGMAQLTFTDRNNGVLVTTIDGVRMVKSISRQVYASPDTTCAAGGAPGAIPNYQDLWWSAPANSESGWGVNLAHQGDVLFVTWFTYGSDGRGMWLVGSDVRKTGSATYAGTLYRTTGPPMAASPWDPSRVTRSFAGSIAFTFADADSGTMTYTLDGVSQTKAITRQVFASPATVCR